MDLRSDMWRLRQHRRKWPGAVKSGDRSCPSPRSGLAEIRRFHRAMRPTGKGVRSEASCLAASTARADSLIGSTRVSLSKRREFSRRSDRAPPPVAGPIRRAELAQFRRKAPLARIVVPAVATREKAPGERIERNDGQTLFLRQWQQLAFDLAE